MDCTSEFGTSGKETGGDAVGIGGGTGALLVMALAMMALGGLTNGL